MNDEFNGIKYAKKKNVQINYAPDTLMKTEEKLLISNDL